MTRFLLFLCAVLLCGGVVIATQVVSQKPAGDASKLHPVEQAGQKLNEGLPKDSLEMILPWTLDPKNADVWELNGMFHRGVHLVERSLQHLNRLNEVDAYLESVVAAHKDKPFALATVAQVYLYATPHNGFIIDNEFYRGNSARGRSGEYVDSFARDRVRGLQLFRDAAALLSSLETKNKQQLASFWFQYASTWMSGRENLEAWRLQFLTDIETLPDYEPMQHRMMNETSKSPVNADGSPLLYHVPESLEAAKNDGERWRFCLEESARIGQDNWSYIAITQRAHFSLSQFGTETLREYRTWFCSPPTIGTTTDDNAAIWSLASLKDDETIAKLATGIKRFKLSDEFHYIALFKAANELKPSDTQPLTSLAGIYAARNQFPTAASYWKQLIEQNPNAGTPQRDAWQNQLNQIVKNWGQFQPTEAQVAGVGADIAFRYRNAKLARFTAHEINIPKLLGDVKAYIKTKPPQINWNKLQIDNIGWQIVQQNERKYIGREVARWSVDLDPPADHFDAMTTITLPTKNAGAYLVRAEMDGGNTDQIVVWVADTVIVKKPLESANNSGALFFVADAETGMPVVDAELECLGFQQEHIDGTNRFKMNVAEQKFQTGQLGIITANDLPQNHQWLITAQSKDKKRLAWLGFTSIWSQQHYDETYNEVKAFFVSDRPVYRPKDAAQFKLWVGTAKYDLGRECEWANREVILTVHNPRGEEIVKKTVKLDAYGSLTDSYTLPADATLGVYAVNVEAPPHFNGGGSFRVEEYRKPEYSVLIEAPREPVSLGDAITATIQAKYFFGSPVTNATVKYKVTRQKTSEDFYPWRTWDWLYGRGYWWFGYDCVWYPGWAKWGCERPLPPWFGRHESGPPEIVAEREVAIGEDGKVQVSIDTSLALVMFPNTSQRYTITAEVVDSSRRTEVGVGNVLVAKEPFKVYAWASRGYYKPQDKIEASFQTRRLDGKPVTGSATVTLYKVTYDGEQREDEIVEPQEVAMHTEKITFGDDGKASVEMNAAEAGQYRLACVVTTADGKTQEGATLLNVFGADRARSDSFAFTALELVPDAAEYASDDTVNLRINTARSGSTVLLFAKPANVYLPPQVLRIDGKSTVAQIPVALRDMPNFFVEAVTVSGGKCYSEVKEIVVPPAKRVLNVDVSPSKDAYKPGESAKATLRVTDENDKPVVGQVAVTVYDKSVEVISGGSNVGDIKEFFWKWRRSHHPQTEHTLDRSGSSITEQGKIPMQQLSAWAMVVPIGGMARGYGMQSGIGGGNTLLRRSGLGVSTKAGRANGTGMLLASPAPMAVDMLGRSEMKQEMDSLAFAFDPESPTDADGESGTFVEATIRENFADTAYWSGVLETNENGEVEIDIAMPESLTTWKIAVWTLALGTRVGEGTAEIITRKDLMIRLHTPRFLVQGDRAVISATVHNYLATAKDVQVSLELGGAVCHSREGGNPQKTVNVAASGEARIDWDVVALQEGDGTFTVKGLTNEESDAMKKTIPVFVHGMFKQEAWSRAIRPNETEAAISVRVPEARRPEATELTVRFSPTLATAMIDAIPYLVDFPYGCTEQTLNRFLPTAITQRVLQEMQVDLATLAEKHTNLNAQQLGDNARPVNQRLFKKNPVYSVDEVQAMSADGVKKLSQMQLGDGGWGWFSGYGEYSSPHLTAIVLHGLRIARECDIAVEPSVIDRGVSWLKKYEARQIDLLNNADFTDEERRARKLDWKPFSDATDALVLMILAEFGKPNATMCDYLWRDRGKISLYGVSMFGIAISGNDDATSRERVKGCVAILSQHLTQDAENQTAFLNLRGVPNWRWWCWYESEFETQAYFLKLLVRTDPKSDIAPQLVKYLLNNRAHGTYWNSTRDTAIIVESFAEYLRATGENKPQMTVEVLYDGEVKKTVEVTPQNLFTIDNTFSLTGESVTSGEHKIVVRKTEGAPLYVNAYLGNFTLENPIAKTGLEVKVERRLWRLVRRDNATAETVGGSGQAIKVAVEKYDRQPFDYGNTLTNGDLIEFERIGDTLASGDLIEVELIVESKNDYESVIIEDFKAAGLEPVEVQSGYNGNSLGAYVEFRDDRVVFFNSLLRQGRHSVIYRLRAETPGSFSALPTKIWGMYAPELKGNSDENKVNVMEKEPPSEQAPAGWPKAMQTVRYFSAVDQSYQPAVFYAPKSEKSVPLLVSLHTWSGDYKQANESRANWCLQNDWALIAPDFRGPNKKPEACGSEFVVADIVAAVDYAKRQANIDADRVYLMGASGGGYGAMLLVGRHPEIWAGVSAWCGISDLADWYREAASRKLGYAKDIAKSCGGVPNSSVAVDEQYRNRSASTWIHDAAEVPLDMNHGVHDGHTGSVPVSHSITAFNLLAAPNKRVTEEQIAFILEKRTMPEELRDEKPVDPLYGNKEVVFRRISGATRLTLFNGGHEALETAGLTWLAQQRKGTPPQW